MTNPADRVVRVAADLMDSAAVEGARQSRSAKQQLDHWARVGRAVSSQQTAARRRVEAGLNGDLEPRELSVEEGVVFNAEIAAAIQDKLAGSNYGMLLAERGVTTVALDENGEIAEQRPDGPSVAVTTRHLGPPSHRRTSRMTERRTSAQDVLRGGILASGHNDFVSMADVQSCISRGQLANSVTERQQLVVDTVRSLLVDALVEVGVIPGRNNPGFKTWPGTADEVMTRFVDRFVGHYDDPLEWEYAIWLNLTPKGEQASAEIVRKRSDSRAER